MCFGGEFPPENPKCSRELNWVSHLWRPSCLASPKQTQKPCEPEPNSSQAKWGRNPFNGFHMLAHPNTCEASFIAILKPLQIFYAQNERKSRGRRECSSGGPNSMFFDCVLRHYHPRLFLHMWLGSRNVFPQPALDDTGRFAGRAHAGWSWRAPCGWRPVSKHAWFAIDDFEYFWF